MRSLGTRPSFDATTGAMLKKFHDTWYKPNNAVLIVVGDVDPAAAFTEIKKQFGGLRRARLPEIPAIRLQPVKPDLLKLTTDAANGEAVIAFRFPGTDDPDFAAADILADVLGSKRGRLYALVPAGKALDIGFSYNAMDKAGVGYLEAQFPKGGDGAALIEEMKKAIAADLKEGYALDLIEAEKRHEVADAEFQENSISGLAMAWSQAVAVEGRSSPAEDIALFNAVTRAGVMQAASKYLDFDQAITAILTPESSGKPTTSQTYGGRESFASNPTKPVKLPKWAKEELNKLVIPDSTLHPVVSVLSNGVQLIVQPENINNTISVTGHIQSRSEMETPPGQEGVDAVLSHFFDYGTRTLDRVAFQKALDDIGANESGGTDFSLQVLADDFDKGLQLLADNELHPAFPEDAFKIIKEQVAQSVAGRLHSPDYLTTRALLAGIYPPHDPKLREETPATVSALTLDDVKSYHQHVFRPDLTTIVIAGNITPEKARAAVEKYFGDWKAEGPKPEVLLPPVPTNSASSTVVPNGSRVQDKVMLAETIGLTRTNEDYYALELGNHVLGGGFYATRLYRDLRRESGLVYSVESMFDIEMTRAVYIVEYACDPPNVTKARSLVEQNLKAMQTTLVSADELHQAQAQVLREIPLGESDIGSIMGGLIDRVTHHLPLDEPTRAAKRYLQMTAPEIKAAYAKWLRPADLVQITEGPAPQ
jgi:zinc protease